MKTIAIMQPYVFPYIGYFQLIHAVDCFVIYDDVQWIQRGWINRNRVLLQGQTKTFTLPVSQGNRDDLIMERRLAPDFDKAAKKTMAWVVQGYRNARKYREVLPLVETCFAYRPSSMSDFVVHSLQKVCDFIGIGSPFLRASDLKVDGQLKGQDRILAICSRLNATRYINPIGGAELYNAESFRRAGIELRFLKARAAPYPQPGVSEFVPFLSIIDVLMNNPVERVREMLEDYELVEAGE